MQALPRQHANSMQTALVWPLPTCSRILIRLSKPAVRIGRHNLTCTAHDGIARRPAPVRASSGNASEDTPLRQLPDPRASITEQQEPPSASRSSSSLSSMEGEGQGAPPPRNFLQRLAISLSGLLSGEAPWAVATCQPSATLRCCDSWVHAPPCTPRPKQLHALSHMWCPSWPGPTN